MFDILSSISKSEIFSKFAQIFSTYTLVRIYLFSLLSSVVVKGFEPTTYMALQSQLDQKVKCVADPIKLFFLRYLIFAV